MSNTERATERKAESDMYRRLPSYQFIHSPHVRHETMRLSSYAPDYFWTVPASSSGFHHPYCREKRGLWLHTLMLSTVIDRLADSYVEQGRLTEADIDYAHAAAILHDQRKNGPVEDPEDSSASDHDILMAEFVQDEGRFPPCVASAIASHMGPWYDGPAPESDLADLVHTADMIASTSHIKPAVAGPLPDELQHFDVEVFQP